MAKPSITKRSTKGAALTYSELDANFQNLSDATLSLTAGSGGTQVTVDLNGNITLVAGSNITLSGDNTAKTITITSSGGGGGLTDIVNDTTPQLGGDLDVNGYLITSANDGDIVIDPNGLGEVEIKTNTLYVGNLGDAVIEAGQSNQGLRLQSSQGTAGASIHISGAGTNSNILITTKSGGALELSSNMTGGTPSNTANPYAYLKIIVQGSATPRYIPLYT